MKILFFSKLILSFMLSLPALAQTELISHKSHSGTNATFNPSAVKGNMGIRIVNFEIKKDPNSKYKLVCYENIGTRYYLFYTERKERQLDVCLENDKILEEVFFDHRDQFFTVSIDNKKKKKTRIPKGKITEVINEQQNRLIAKLEALREQE